MTICRRKPLPWSLHSTFQCHRVSKQRWGRVCFVVVILHFDIRHFCNFFFFFYLQKCFNFLLFVSRYLCSSLPSSICCIEFFRMHDWMAKLCEQFAANVLKINLRRFVLAIDCESTNCR